MGEIGVGQGSKGESGGWAEELRVLWKLPWTSNLSAWGCQPRSSASTHAMRCDPLVYREIPNTPNTKGTKESGGERAPQSSKCDLPVRGKGRASEWMIRQGSGREGK